MNSNLIASSHSLHFHLATVVQKDKRRFSFSAKICISICSTLWITQRIIISVLSIHSRVLRCLEKAFYYPTEKKNKLKIIIIILQTTRHLYNIIVPKLNSVRHVLQMGAKKTNKHENNNLKSSKHVQANICRRSLNHFVAFKLKKISSTVIDFTVVTTETCSSLKTEIVWIVWMSPIVHYTNITTEIQSSFSSLGYFNVRNIHPSQWMGFLEMGRDYSTSMAWRRFP